MTTGATARNVRPALIDPAEVLRTFDTFVAPGQVTEIRAVDASFKGERFETTISGYFDNAAAAVKELGRIGSAASIYFVPNRVDPALLARRANRLDKAKKDSTTNDGHIQRRQYILVDADAIRASGISSSDEEHTSALARIAALVDYLSQNGWPEPITADSGNGGHALYRIDLPAEDGGIIERFLKALSSKFTDEMVKIDTSVHNPSRVWKLYGTCAGKGDSIPSRPHRMSAILSIPETISEVPQHLIEQTSEMLEAEAAEAKETAGADKAESPKPAAASKPAAKTTAAGKFDLDEWIRKYEPTATGPEPWSSKFGKGRRWALSACPFNADHTGTCAFVGELPSGAAVFTCLHDSCGSRTWRDFRELREPEARKRREEYEKRSRAASEKVRAEAPAGGADAGDFPLTDAGNGERLMHRYRKYLRYVSRWERWMLFTGTHWQIDETGAAYRLAIETVRHMKDVAAAMPEDQGPLAVKLFKHAVACEARKRVADMLVMASKVRGAAVMPDQLDADPWLLNVRNGTLNLNAGAFGLRPHQADDYLTKCCPAEYDPSLTCPAFLAFLDRIFEGNERLIAFVRRMIGYTLTGTTGERCLFMMYGAGANGKSTLLAVIRELLAGYAMQAAAETILAKRGEGIPNDVARLKGARFVSAVESDEGRRMAEAKVKAMCGGEDVLTARFMRAEFFDFKPEFKLFIATNHRPEIAGTDDAIWDRVKLVPFNVRIPEPERDKNLLAKLKAELGGILAWAVQGCLEWQRDGLGVPAEVQQATRAYRADMDKLGDFLTSCCVLGVDARGAAFVAQATPLYETYKTWCGLNGETPISQKKFGGKLSDRGFAPDRDEKSGRSTWKGIGIRVSEPSE